MRTTNSITFKFPLSTIFIVSNFGLLDHEGCTRVFPYHGAENVHPCRCRAPRASNVSTKPFYSNFIVWVQFSLGTTCACNWFILEYRIFIRGCACLPVCKPLCLCIGGCYFLPEGARLVAIENLIRLLFRRIALISQNEILYEFISRARTRLEQDIHRKYIFRMVFRKNIYFLF